MIVFFIMNFCFLVACWINLHTNSDGGSPLALHHSAQLQGRGFPYSFKFPFYGGRSLRLNCDVTADEYQSEALHTFCSDSY